MVIIVGFLLLLLAFRSLLMAAMAGGMNLLGGAAVFGVLVAIFQFGWGLHALNLGQAGPVESSLPVLPAPVLFGLSMDYQVFLVSRAREEWVANMTTTWRQRPGKRRPVGSSLPRPASCSSSSPFSSSTVAKSSGNSGSAWPPQYCSAPSSCARSSGLSCHLSGRASWWLPGWLDRVLPHLAIEPAVGSVAQPSVVTRHGASGQHKLGSR